MLSHEDRQDGRVRQRKGSQGVEQYRTVHTSAAALSLWWSHAATASVFELLSYDTQEKGHLYLEGSVGCDGAIEASGSGFGKSSSATTGEKEINEMAATLVLE